MPRQNTDACKAVLDSFVNERLNALERAFGFEDRVIDGRCNGVSVHGK
jgi:hypothetical protein